MKISQVMELTGLTKKAIHYYEEAGLIQPVVNAENNYREYSQSDIDKLVQISVLRQLDVPVKDIKDILTKPEMLKEQLELHLSRMNDELKRLEKSRGILQSCLKGFDAAKGELSQFTKQLSVLNQSLEMDARKREGFMKSRLQQIFPGNFGRMLVIHFSPFLNEPIDTPEKEEAWMNIVAFLDRIENAEYVEEMKEMYEMLTEEDMEKYAAFSNENMRKWSRISDEELDRERERALESVRKMTTDPDLQSVYRRTSRMSEGIKEQMKRIGYYDTFIENLKILSNDYAGYNKKITEFYTSLNLKFDDKGRIVEETNN
mgnify:CR=1 FL=1